MATGFIDFLKLVSRAGSKEGARILFEQLIAQIANALYPGARQVRPNPGDAGIDAFIGELDQAVAVWQAKFFIDGVGTTQQAQIADSLTTLMNYAKNNSIKITQWTLCIPVSFDNAGHLWWTKLKRDAEKKYGIQLELWDVTKLTSLLLGPDTRIVREYFFGTDGPLERAIEELPDATLFDDSLFVRQLREAGHLEMDASKREFYNAEILAKEISDKGVKEEVQELASLRSTLHSMWSHRFNAACLANTDNRLIGLHSTVMDAVEAAHQSLPRWNLPAGLVHKFGLIHQLVDVGRAGWVRSWQEVARDHGR